MKKQRAFATLSEQEIDHTQTYDEVLTLVRKPRPEGFGLNISRKPLELLHAKTMTVDKINRRVQDGQRITRAEFDAINAGEKVDHYQRAPQTLRTRARSSRKRTRVEAITQG